ncbi:MAG: Slp family lipoprotein [Smithella sp.]
MKLKIFSLILLLIISCTPFSREVIKESKKDVNLSDVVKNPEKYKGELIIWGGVIVETISKPDETLIIVRQTELDFEKRPENLDKSAGRFMIQYQGFLDPVIYSKGREVTVAGTIAGTEERAIGEHRYIYPIVKAREIHLWEKITPQYYYDPWLYRDPFLYPWFNYPYFPYRPYP